jgi:hypothetical protein
MTEDKIRRRGSRGYGSKDQANRQKKKKEHELRMAMRNSALSVYIQ